MAGFTLNLHIGGLCLMVPDFNRDDRCMHVLLPPCDHDGDPHFPTLIFDRAAEVQNQPPERVPLKDPLFFAGAEFDLSSQSNDPPVQGPPAAVANLTQVFQGYVPRSFLDTDEPGAEVSARLRFAAGNSQVHPCGAGGVWFFPDDFDLKKNPNPASPQLPIRVFWTMHVDSDRLEVAFTSINKSAVKDHRTFFPWKDRLDLWVFNSPKGQLPTSLPPLNSSDSPPDPLDPAEHFASLYPLCGLQDEERVPTFHHLGRIPDVCFPTVAHPGLDLMCIGAQAQPVP